MGHRVIYIENSEYLNLYLDNLKVHSDKGELKIPLSDISLLVIDNNKSNMSIPLINRLADFNVSVIICGIDHLPKSFLLPLNGHFSQSGNLFKQIQWQENDKKLIHQLIVRAKIFNQIEILKKHNKNFEVVQKLTTYRYEVEHGDITNREGLAAKMYFREMYGDNFTRFDDDVINAGLNYGYSIFRSLISSIIVSKGYIPNLGFFHKSKTNMFNLSDDIIEVFRPIVDDWVLENLFDEIIFKREHRLSLIRLVTYKVEIDGRKQTISNAINIYFESILKVLETKDVQDFIFPLPHCYDL